MNDATSLVGRNGIPLSELEALKREIEALEGLDLHALRRRWRRVMGRPAPAHLSLSLLLRILAYRRQIAQFGDISRATRAALDESIGDLNCHSGRLADQKLRSKASMALRPGTVLEREYAGVLHRATVTKGGCSWNGQDFRSLSQAARAITGTKWNGPRFFGLRLGKRAERVEDDNISSAAWRP
jgi:hypothetical protein